MRTPSVTCSPQSRGPRARVRSVGADPASTSRGTRRGSTARHPHFRSSPLGRSGGAGPLPPLPRPAWPVLVAPARHTMSGARRPSDPDGPHNKPPHEQHRCAVVGRTLAGDTCTVVTIRDTGGHVVIYAYGIAEYGVRIGPEDKKRLARFLLEEGPCSGSTDRGGRP